MSQKTSNKKNKWRQNQQNIMSNEEEDIILNRNPGPEDIDRFIDKLLTHNVASRALVTFLVYTKERQAYGPHFSDDYVYFCLSSYFILKDNYEDISQRYELPPKSFLMTALFKKFTFLPGIALAILDLFKVKTEHCKPESRICVLLIDELALSPNVTMVDKYGAVGFNDSRSEIAQFVTTIWVCPVGQKACIPLAYYFTYKSSSADLLQQYLFGAISSLDSIGIDVVGVVGKVKRNLLKLSQNLNISTANQSFKVGDKNVLFLFDVHHLINITRDNFLTYRLDYGEGITSPKDVGNFFFTEWKYSDEATITKSHLIPDRVQSTCIQYATELLSNSVAYAMEYYISAELMPKFAIGTARCIKKFDKLFKIMNSTKMNFGNHFESGYYGGRSQTKFMQEMIEFFENLRVYDSLYYERTDQLIFIRAWIISIKGMMQLWDVMKQKNYPHLFTNYINFEQMDSFVRNLQIEGDSYRNPTAWNFLELFEDTFVSQFFQYWPRDYSPDNGEFNIDADYAQKVFKRIPAITHDITGRTKRDKNFFPELKNTARFFNDFLEAWSEIF